MPVLGYVLSGASTSTALIQLTAEGESRVEEGALVGIKTRQGVVIARIDAIRCESPLFRLGDGLSLARRTSNELKELVEISGVYCIAEASLLGKIGPDGLKDLNAPPRPGDEVIDLSDMGKDKVFGVSNRYGVVWINGLAGCESVSVPLNVEALTMHLGVFGETGSGKSYTMGYLLEKLSEIPTPLGLRALPAIVVDANGDYLDIYEEFVERKRFGSYGKVLRLVFPTSRHLYKPFTKPITLDLDELEPRELASLVVAYRFGSPEANELQLHALTRLFEFIRERGISFNTAFTKINYLEKALESISEEMNLHPQTLRAVKSAIQKLKHDLVDRYAIITGSEVTICREFVDEVTKGPYLVIIDFSPDGAPGVPLIVKQFVIAYISKVLYTSFTEYKLRGDERYLLFVIEEAQNYIPNPRTYPIGFSVARDSISLIATQGRKFGICLAIVSQRPAFIDPVVLSMINTWFIHRVAPEDANYISRICGGLPPSLERKLTRLPRGTCLLMGQMNIVGIPLLLRIGSRRIGHKVGKTALVETIAKYGPKATS